MKWPCCKTVHHQVVKKFQVSECQVTERDWLHCDASVTSPIAVPKNEVHFVDEDHPDHEPLVRKGCLALLFFVHIFNVRKWNNSLVSFSF
jgi:hypothetical protein